jgi:hypothetical protein
MHDFQKVDITPAAQLSSTAAVRVRFQGAMPSGICGGRSSTGAGFPQALRFPLPIIITQTGPYSLLYNLHTDTAVI